MPGREFDGLITTKEAAVLLDCHPSTVTRMVAKGTLEPVRNVRAAFLFHRSDVEALRAKVA